MRLLLAMSLMLMASVAIFAQDGGDMGYFKPADLDKSFEGYSVHLDFGKQSRKMYSDNAVDEEFDFDVKGRKIKFREHRADDGYNNWFRDQYLESVAPVDGKSLRLKHFELLEVKKKEFRVKAFFVFADKDGEELPKESFTADYDFKKSEIAKVLVESKALRDLRTKEKRPQ